MKKTIITIILTFFVVCLSLTAVACKNDDSEVLYIYNWGDYIDEDILDEFAEEYGEKYGVELEIVYSTFDTNEIMLTNVIKGDDNIDLICPSEYAIEKVLRAGAAKKLDYEKIPNKENVMSEIYQKVDEVFKGITVDDQEVKMSDYFVPYMWGTLGILYNENYVTEEDIASGYGIMWNDADNPDLDGKIMIKDSIRDTYVAAVLHLKETGSLPEGYDDMSVQDLINTLDPTIIGAVEETLTEQKKYLKEYEVDFGKQDMVAERAYVDLAWSGDALWAMEDGEFLNYYVPEVGGNIWFDGWVILENCQNERASYEFLDFVCRPEIAIRNSMSIGYTSALDKDVMYENETVCEIIEENEYDVDEYFDDEIRYPVIEGSPLGVMKDFGSMNQPAVEMWERVKSQTGDSTWLLYVVFGVIGIIALVVGAYLFIKNRLSYRRIKKM